MNRLDAIAAAVARLARGGGLLSDVFHETTRSAHVSVEDGRVETALDALRDGAGLRLCLGEQTLFAHESRPDAGALLRLADDVVRGSKNGTSSAVAFGTPRSAATPVKRPFAQLPLYEKTALCLEADRAARAVDTKVRQVVVSYRDHSRDFVLAASDGRLIAERQEGVYFSVMVVASEGDVVQTGYEALGRSSGWELFDETPVVEIAVTAARRAVRMLRARRAPGGVMPVVLAASAGGTMIHEAVGHGLEADLVEDGHSIYKGRIGQPIAAPTISVMDDPTLPGRRGSYAFDDEGTPAAPTVLVENGILKGWLHSRTTAAKMGLSTSGNGRRESYLHPPIPRMSNTFIAPGREDPAAIVRDTTRGLYVTRMGGGQVNTLSGDFVFEVSEGFIIENGRIGEPVRGATLAGNGPKILLSIDRVGNDLGFGVGTCGKDGQGAPVADAQPTLRIPEITVGGQNSE